MITLLTGEIQTGKTSLCLEVLEHARQEGVRLGGLISPGVFSAGEKVAIDVLDLSSGERRRLAERLVENSPQISTKRWAFLPETISWGNKILSGAVPCDLLMIDELGPLEFHREQGWVEGFRTIESGDYRAALLVIRPSLLDEAVLRWNVRRVIDLDDPEETLRRGQDLVGYLLDPRA